MDHVGVHLLLLSFAPRRLQRVVTQFSGNQRYHQVGRFVGPWMPDREMEDQIGARYLAGRHGKSVDNILLSSILHINPFVNET